MTRRTALVIVPERVKELAGGAIDHWCHHVDSRPLWPIMIAIFDGGDYTDSRSGGILRLLFQPINTNSYVALPW